MYAYNDLYDDVDAARFSFPGGREQKSTSACKFAQYIKLRISRDIPQSAVLYADEYNFIIVNRVVVL